MNLEWRISSREMCSLLAIAFVASIPYTKAAHMITSYLSLSLRDPLAGKRLAVIPPERASEPAGYGKLQDFSPLHLLQLDACTKCGRCHAACPANATGRPLSPRDVVLELHEQSNVAIGGVLGGLMSGRLDGGAGLAADLDAAIRPGDEEAFLRQLQQGVADRPSADAEAPGQRLLAKGVALG